jgi:hypothetical protein
MNIGDDIDTPEGKGKIKEIQGEGRVAVVEVPYTAYKTVYVRMPEPAAPSPSEAVN